MSELDDLARRVCAHIEEPMSVRELVEYVASDDYSAELALQHAILALQRSVDLAS